MKLKRNCLGKILMEKTAKKNQRLRAENWLSQQYRTQDNPQQNEKITQRHDKFSIFQPTRTVNPVMSRQVLGVNNTLPLKVAQDGLNPTLRQTITRLITVDSQYRSLDIPYTGNPNDSAKATATNFTIGLTEPLKNVLTLTLESLFIPNTWYTFDPYYRNTCMWILTAASKEKLEEESTIPKATVSWTDPTADISSCNKICITPGTYNTVADLIVEINQDISMCGGHDISGGKLFQVQMINGNVVAPILQFFNFTNNWIKVLFYRNDLTEEYGFEDCSGCAQPVTACPQSMTYRQNLGYYLGFRITENYKSELSIIIEPFINAPGAFTPANQLAAIANLALATAAITQSPPQYKTYSKYIKDAAAYLCNDYSFCGANFMPNIAGGETGSGTCKFRGSTYICT